MMKVVCLVWRTLLPVKVTGWFTCGVSSLTVEGQREPSAGLEPWSTLIISSCEGTKRNTSLHASIVYICSHRFVRCNVI